MPPKERVIQPVTDRGPKLISISDQWDAVRKIMLPLTSCVRFADDTRMLPSETNHQNRTCSDASTKASILFTASSNLNVSSSSFNRNAGSTSSLISRRRPVLPRPQMDAMNSSGRSWREQWTMLPSARRILRART